VLKVRTRKTGMAGVIQHVRRVVVGYFITGLLAWIPLIVTVWVVRLLINNPVLGIERLARDMIGYVRSLGERFSWLSFLSEFKYQPGIGIVMVVMIFLLTGILTQYLLGRRLIGSGEKILARIPLISRIYRAVKQIRDVFFDRGGAVFQRVCLVEYPRPGLVAVAFVTSSELLTLSGETGRTRIPIYEETIDKIIGIVNTYDILADVEPDNPKWDRFIKPVQRVPDSMKLDDLLEFLKREKQHLVVVIDEYGGTDGIVTMEDILEEIFGEIEDEHDPEEKLIRKSGEYTYIIDARMPLEEAAEFIGIELEDDAVETVGGWVMRRAGRIPEPGDVITYNGFRITILEGGNNVVVRIRLDIQPREETPSAQSSNA